MATTPEEKIIEIPVVEEVLSNGMAAVMLVCGAVAGAFVLWAWLEYQKGLSAQRIGNAIAESHIPEPIEIEAIPERRGDNRFSAFQQG